MRLSALLLCATSRVSSVSASRPRAVTQLTNCLRRMLASAPQPSPRLPFELIQRVLELVLLARPLEDQDPDSNTTTYQLVHSSWCHFVRHHLRTNVREDWLSIDTFDALCSSPNRAALVTAINLQHVDVDRLDTLLLHLRNLVWVDVVITAHEEDAYTAAEVAHWRRSSPFLHKNLPSILTIAVAYEELAWRVPNPIVTTLRPLALALAPFSTLKHLRAQSFHYIDSDDERSMDNTPVPSPIYTLKSLAIDHSNLDGVEVTSFATTNQHTLQSLEILQSKYAAVSDLMDHYQLVTAASQSLRRLLLPSTHFITIWHASFPSIISTVHFPHLMYLTLHPINDPLETTNDFDRLRNLIVAPSLISLTLHGEGSLPWTRTEDLGTLYPRRSFSLYRLANFLNTKHFPTLEVVRILEYGSKGTYGYVDPDQNCRLLRQHRYLIGMAKRLGIEIEFSKDHRNYLRQIERWMTLPRGSIYLYVLFQENGQR